MGRWVAKLDREQRCAMVHRMGAHVLAGCVSVQQVQQRVWLGMAAVRLIPSRPTAQTMTRTSLPTEQRSTSLRRDKLYSAACWLTV